MTYLKTKSYDQLLDVLRQLGSDSLRTFENQLHPITLASHMAPAKCNAAGAQLALRFTR